jgi:hypothetical protein
VAVLHARGKIQDGVDKMLDDVAEASSSNQVEPLFTLRWSDMMTNVSERPRSASS